MKVDQSSSELPDLHSPSLERAVAERIDAGAIGVAQIRILVLCMILVCLDGYDIASMGLAVPLIAREWNVSLGAFGGSLAAVMVGSAVGGFTLGWLGDRIGRRPIVIISAIGIGLASLGSTWAANVTQMIAWRILIGIAFGTGLPNVYALVGESVPLRRRTFCSTLLAASTSVGGIAGGLTAPILSSWLGWKGIFLAGGLTTLLIALLMAFLLGESPQVLAACARVRELVAALAAFDLDNTNLPEPRPVPKSRRHGPLSLIQDGLFWISLFYLLGYIFCGFGYYVLSNWLPALLTHSGWPSNSAQRSIAIVYGGSMVGGLALSWVMDRWQRGNLFVPVIVFGSGAMLFVAVGSLLTSPLVLPLLCALAFMIGGGQYVMPALAVRFFPPSLLATALSWFFPLSRVGGFSGSLAGGWMLLAGWTGSQIMMVLGLAPLLSAIAFAALSVSVTRQQRASMMP